MENYQRVLATWLLLAASACGREQLGSALGAARDDDTGISEGAYYRVLAGGVEVHGAREDDGYVRARLNDERGRTLLALLVGEPSDSKVAISFTYHPRVDGKLDFEELKGELELSWRRGTEISPRTASELLTFLYGSVSAELRPEREGCESAGACADCCDSHDACFMRNGCDARSWFSFGRRKAQRNFVRLGPEADECGECNTRAWECIANQPVAVENTCCTDAGSCDQPPITEADAGLGGLQDADSGAAVSDEIDELDAGEPEFGDQPQYEADAGDSGPDQTGDDPWVDGESEDPWGEDDGSSDDEDAEGGDDYIGFGDYS